MKTITGRKIPLLIIFTLMIGLNIGIYQNCNQLPLDSGDVGSKGPPPVNNVTTINIGYLYQNNDGRFKHRMLIQNRGPDAPYAFTFKAPVGSEVIPASNASGILPADSVTIFVLFNSIPADRDLIEEIRGGVHTTAIFTATADPNDIDITTFLLDPNSGAPNVVKYSSVTPRPTSSVTTINIGYLYQDNDGRFKHRMLIQNRGPDAPYAFTFKAPVGLEVIPASNASGILPANSVTRFVLFNSIPADRDLIEEIRGGVHTTAAFTATADPNDIDITTFLLDPSSGAPNVVRHSPVQQ